ncbi:hypothetical protein [Arthrobacter sunyaminii]|uniref:hypothetical protein n=1 Tax=Arthrobacter sunyaminii TaxID=2816859 RepID=UPI001A9456F0|nr:hypothetical protein [Arthrobacter sunyaminii]MBO0896836.1 hypothetical protein [Arthrobacter sunyaminii]
MKNSSGQPPQPPNPKPVSLVPLFFALGVILLGLWAAWVTGSWVLLAVAVAVAVLPARTYGGDVRTWARRRARGGPVNE